MATMSILGLYNYDKSLFDNLVLPNGVDRETLIDNLCIELAELEILYPNPDFLKAAIGVWSRKEFASWEKLYTTTTFKYDPISNYDRTEIWEDSGSSSGADNTKVAGFNSSELVDSGKSDNKSEYKNSHTGHTYGNIGITTTQQMIEEERRIVVWNIYDHIIQSFKKRFCILVY